MTDFLAQYNGSALVSASGNKMVFVEFQYRVGMYGFLASQDIKNDGNLNAGLLDQRAALLWVQKYISKVGAIPVRISGLLRYLVRWRSFTSCHCWRFGWSFIRCPTPDLLRWQRASTK